MQKGRTRNPLWLKNYAKALVFCTFFLLFAGGMVKSTGSGLAVPDWPLSYGMLFPPMIGGIFYEHGHRMIASLVGFMTLLMFFFTLYHEKRRSVKKIAFFCLLLVIVQGLFGGLTVLFFLPTWISCGHALLAQTFFLSTIFLASCLCDETFFEPTSLEKKHSKRRSFLLVISLFLALLYGQLFLGALVRHTESGLAIHDFPLNAGSIIPSFDKEMLQEINDWNFEKDLPYVNMIQVVLHFIHRLGAFVILIFFTLMTFWIRKYFLKNAKIISTLYWIGMGLILQVMLGAITVLSMKLPIIATLHLLCGAFLMGMTFLMFLRGYRTL
ncbi:hypothetical protein AB834_05425 [PVC group bacterium (ex Bugula neritina AB1)]|nr:hypothetical protein AB834_05425 [PVC group bacterium (ex Bugula neritina AB1)]